MKALMGIVCVITSVILARGAAMAQSERLSAVIEVSSSLPAQADTQTAYLNGYHRTVDGQTISYHSSHPDAEKALLVRARRDVRSISWETDTLPESYSGTFYQFIWLAGIECQGWGNLTLPREFRLYINNELWFSFLNRKDSMAAHWTVPGKDGAALRFDSRVADKFGDLFGHMYMTLPKQDFRPGLPLTIRVEGEDADSPEWFMTFTYRFNFKPRVRPEPVLMRNKERTAQQLRFSLDNLEPGRSVTISMAGQKTVARPLGIGGNVFWLPIPAVMTETPMDIVFIRDGAIVEQSTTAVTPAMRRDIYLLPYSHNDIGYTDLQPNVERKHWGHLEEALRLIRATRDYPYESRFKWNMEVLWPLESYLSQVSPEGKEELLGAIRGGSIGLNALYVNPLTGLATSSEMAHFLDFARRFSEEYSIPIHSATTSDIPGFTWGIVPALAHSGVKYFSSGPNAGDRIGHVSEQWGDKPFYWASQSGRERVLFWVAGASYSSFHQATLAQTGPEKIMKLARKLIDDKYPYDIYYLPYTLGDNGGPDSTLSTFVRTWNEQYITPRLIIATHEQMFRDFEQKYGTALPTFAGDFTPYWEDGAASSARETALNRRAVDRLMQAEAIWSLRSPDTYPKSLFDQAWRDVVLWDEHTWGADKSVTDPDDPMTRGQWRIKQQFALRADSQSIELLRKALGEPGLVQKNEVVLDVYNTTSWPRSDLIVLDATLSTVGDRVEDDSGIVLLSQRLSTGELAVLVHDVPPLGARRITVKAGHATANGDARAQGNTVENGFLSAVIDTTTGSISSLIDKGSRSNLVDTASGNHINRYIYVPGTNPDSAQYCTNVRIKVKENGPLVASLIVEADAPGCKRFVSEIRVVHDLNRVDIINLLDKAAIRSKEGVHFAFPLNVPNGTMRYDVASGIVQPEKNQLAGSCKNFYSVASWVDISNDASGVTWTTPDAPLIEIGSITAEAPWMKTNQPATTFFSYVMNNYWHTNYKADQEGTVQFRYSLFPHSEFNGLQAARAGREQRQPLIATVVKPGNPLCSPLLNIKPNEIIVESIKPVAGDNAWLLCLYNPTPTVVETQITPHERRDVKLSLCDSFAKKGQLVTGPLTVAAFATQYIRIDRE